MVDNFEQIKALLTFDSDDDFYFCQIIKRKKENEELGSNSHVVKTYFIKSAADIDKDRGEMVCLAEYHNARVCINLNRRSFEKMAFHSLRKIADIIMNKDYAQARKAYASSCGVYSAEEDKKWIVDIDVKGRVANDVLQTIDECMPTGNKLITILDTKNGVHLITKPFDVRGFRQKHPGIDIHKNNPTIMYIP